TPRSTLFPSTTLFRSAGSGDSGHSTQHTALSTQHSYTLPPALGPEGFFRAPNLAATGRRTARYAKHRETASDRECRQPRDCRRRSEEHTSELQSRENL